MYKPWKHKRLALLNFDPLLADTSSRSELNCTCCHACLPYGRLLTFLFGHIVMGT